MSTIHEIREASQDDETRHQIALLRRTAEPRLTRARWQRRFDGEDGLGLWDFPRKGLRLIHSIERCEGDVWSHVSVSRRDRVMPTWEQTRDVFWLIHDQAYGLIVVAPPHRHVNKAEVSHVWANLSRPTVPDFTHGLGAI